MPIKVDTDFNLLINGASRAGSTGDGAPVLNPVTGEAIGRVAYASDEDLSDTVATAARGLREWRTVPAWERGRPLKRAADVFVRKLRWPL
jgi:succinate-semialdehyde dehydrogenase/glutarate-semialdehyde dehydrogenase